MPLVVGIRFKDSGKTYFFDPNGVETLDRGDHVICLLYTSDAADE